MVTKELVKKSACPVVLETEATISEVARAFATHEIKVIPLVDSNGVPKGMLTINEFIKGCLEKGLDSSLPVSAIMDKNFTVVPRNLEYSELQKLPGEKLPMVDDDGRLIDLIDKLDLIKKQYQIVERQRARMISVLELLPVGLIVANREGVIEFINPAGEMILGIQAQINLGQKISSLLPPECFPNGSLVQHNLRTQLNDKMIVISTIPLEEGPRNRGKIVCLYDLSKIPIEDDNMKELESIVEASYDGMVLADDEKILRVNTSFERISELTADEMVGMRVMDLGAHICFQSIKDVFLKVCEQKSSYTVCGQLGENEIFITGTPILTQDKQIFRVILNVRDVTELNNLRVKVETAKELSQWYRSELEQLKAEYLDEKQIVIESQAMRQVIELTLRVSRVDSTVLIHGESGTGKEVIARMIYRLSERHTGPFIHVNCGAIPHNLLESELFGYESGSFTGASRSGKPGLFELANDGVLFLDEIGEVPYSLQVKLLKAIQDQEILRIGGTKPLKLNLRIICATNRNLAEMVEKGTFREDLFYRLNVLPIYIPPLRERKDDIIPLAVKFLSYFNRKHNFNKKFSPEALNLLENCDWPGNVREVQNIVERLAILSEQEIITSADLPKNIFPKEISDAKKLKVEGFLPLREARAVVEKALLTKALKNSPTTRGAAKLLGVDHSTVVRKAKKYGIYLSVFLLPGMSCFFH